MRERKYVKFRVDMYDDTKFKIIDMKAERDLIHYVWTRFVTLAGKVNLEGELYLSKNIPYTIETLAIEFNRGVDQVKLAIDVLLELEMIELTEHKIYRVKNFVKHQNIKVKEKIESKDKKIHQNNKEVDENNKEVQVNENLKERIHSNKNNSHQNKISENEAEVIINNEENSLEIIDKDSSKADDNIYSNSQENTPILLEMKKKRKSNKSKKKDNSIECIDEEIDDNQMFYFSDGDEERPLGDGESVVGQWSF